MQSSEQALAHSKGAQRAPLVTVVIAAFNAMAHIEETCLSALAQTYRPLEVIVVDDGSTDRTGTIVEALATNDPRIRLIRQQNRGVAAARNVGIAAATGEFVAPLDADDIWDETKIERQVRQSEQRGPDTGLVYSWWAWIDNARTVLDCSPRWDIEGRVLEQLAEVNFTGGASVPLYRRACLEQVGGYNEGLRNHGNQGCEDWDLALRVAERFNISFVPAVLVGYRRRNDGMSAKCETMWRSHKQVLAELAARQPSLEMTTLERSTAQFALYLAGVSFWSGNYGQAVRWGLRSRSVPLALAVLPHVARIFGHRIVEIVAPRSTWSRRFGDAPLPEPLMPYDRIYKRRWGMGSRQ
jgi:glycosyltransferase involved in cell wall biosynthesis